MNDSPSPQPIVVGVDGSESSRRALEWAIDEANRRRRPLWLICAWTLDYSAGMTGRLAPYLQHDCERNLVNARRAVETQAPALTISTQRTQGHPASALIDASTQAFLVVVGSRGLGPLHLALVGSTSMAVASHAQCPVVVVQVQSEPSPARRVVVGIDGSPASTEALRYAFDQANERGLGLTAVHAWGISLMEGAVGRAGLVENLDKLGHEQQALTGEWIDPWREQFPDVDVHIEVTQARPVDALIDASHEAELLVVGSRGRGGFAGLLLGSVSRGVLHRAQCPVAVIHAHRTPQSRPVR